MDKFKIEKDVPLPQNHSGGRPLKYPFHKMEVGDSVFIPGDIYTRNNARNAAYRVKRINAGRFISQSEAEDGIKGIRFWRVE